MTDSQKAVTGLHRLFHYFPAYLADDRRAQQLIERELTIQMMQIVQESMGFPNKSMSISYRPYVFTYLGIHRQDRLSLPQERGVTNHSDYSLETPYMHAIVIQWLVALVNPLQALVGDFVYPNHILKEDIGSNQIMWGVSPSYELVDWDPPRYSSCSSSVSVFEYQSQEYRIPEHTINGKRINKLVLWERIR